MSVWGNLQELQRFWGPIDMGELVGIQISIAHSCVKLMKPGEAGTSYFVVQLVRGNCRPFCCMSVASSSWMKNNMPQ